MAHGYLQKTGHVVEEPTKTGKGKQLRLTNEGVKKQVEQLRKSVKDHEAELQKIIAESAPRFEQWRKTLDPQKLKPMIPNQQRLRK